MTAGDQKMFDIIEELKKLQELALILEQKYAAALLALQDAGCDYCAYDTKGTEAPENMCWGCELMSGGNAAGRKFNFDYERWKPNEGNL